MLNTLPLTLLAALPLLQVWAAPYVIPLDSFSVSASHPRADSSTTRQPVAMSWFTGWEAVSTATPPFTPANISWSKYTAVSYAMAATSPDSGTITLDSSDETLLPQFVDLAHQNNVNALLTIGGWGGSLYFSSSLAIADNRTQFTTAVLDLVSKYNLDGIDLDWEYPNNAGIGCNTHSEDDVPNFLSFLQELRGKAPNLTLSAAVSLKPFQSNVSAFADVLDYIEIMNYDVWGSWDTVVGPNSPLNDTCAGTGHQAGSAVSAVSAWTAAGFPASKIVLGVAGYGHSFSVDASDAYEAGSTSTLAAYPAFVQGKQPLGDSWDSDVVSTNECGVSSGASGVYNLWGLVEDGFLTDNGTVAEGIDYRFDSCSQTPYVYNPSTQVMVSYDNAESFYAKGQFINETGLLGFAMWQTGSDYEDILLDSISGAIGLKSTAVVSSCA